MIVHPTKLLRLIWVLFLTGVLSACGDGIGDLRAYVEQMKKHPPDRIEPIPEFQPYQSFEYTSQNLRNPFVSVNFSLRADSVESNSTSSGLQPSKGRMREPLEDYPLDTLRLKGTLTKGGIKWGLVFSPDNTIHHVLEGQYMGQNHGRIISITDERIELTEIVPDGSGNYIERSSAIALIE